MRNSSAQAPPVLAVACGGTGGHFYPGLTIAKAFAAAGGKSVLFIGGHHMEEQLEIARKNGMEAVAAPAVRLPRSPVQLLKFPFAFLGCIRQSASQLARCKVDVALGMGSFASVPMGLAARMKGIPLALHEGNACLGQANRFLSRWAQIIGLSFPLRTPQATHAKQVLVGMPIREAIIDAAAKGFSTEDRKRVCEELDFEADKPVVFIFGGSQGARAINEAVAGLLPTLPDDLRDWQFLHLTGKKENAVLEAAYHAAGLRAKVLERDPGIERFYRLADAIICRAGASTILELAIMRKAPLMIPFPGAKENHQMVNALSVMEANGGWLIPESELSPEKLVEHLKCVREEANTKQGITKFAHIEAAKEMAEELLKLLA